MPDEIRRRHQTDFVNGGAGHGSFAGTAISGLLKKIKQTAV